MSRRELFRMIGATAGSAAMFQAMAAMGFTAESALSGADRAAGHAEGRFGADLGAGIAGMTAAYELRNAAYKVQVLGTTTARRA